MLIRSEGNLSLLFKFLDLPSGGGASRTKVLLRTFIDPRVCFLLLNAELFFFLVIPDPQFVGVFCLRTLPTGFAAIIVADTCVCDGIDGAPQLGCASLA